MEGISEEQKELWRKQDEYAKREIKHDEIAELEEPIRRILKRILPKIEAGEYGLIIGDDASARIPTRVFSKVINAIYDNYGFRHPDVRFIAGSRTSQDERQKKEEMVDLYLRNKNVAGHVPKVLRPNEDVSAVKLGVDLAQIKRVLIVTDTIGEGRSMSLLSNVLEDLHTKFDVATIARTDSSPGVTTKIKGPIYSGGTGIPSIYGEKQLSGVKKESTDLFSTRIPDNVEKVSTARKDAAIVADHLIEWYNEEKKDEK